jgi:hypothetical protein
MVYREMWLWKPPEPVLRLYWIGDDRYVAPTPHGIAYIVLPYGCGLDPVIATQDG